MIKAIISDAFGTLFKVTGGASARTIISNIEQSGISICEKDFFEEWKSFYRNMTKDGTDFLTERDIFIARIKMFYDRYGVSRDSAADTDELLKEAHTRGAYDDAVPTIYELKKNHTVYIGSNTDNSVLDSVMKANGVEVDKVYTSEKLGCYKPSPRFYRYILEENGLSPEEVLFVGDSPTDDIDGPQRCGIKTCLIDRNYTDTKNIKPDLIVETLFDIPERIKEL